MGDTRHVADLGEWVQGDPQASKPLFDQLRSQIIDGIRGGRLTPGTRLPTVRELAGQLGMAVNTVARAYRELEAAGILETRGRFGTFVARTDPADAAMATAAHTYATAAKSLGIEKDEALKYVEAAFD
jgi:DNA-binding transcriptional regulator YhcF (GntR family)